MKPLKIINKIAILTAALSFVFAAIEIILTYFAIIIINQTTEIPAEYLLINALPPALPYLFVGVIAAIIVVFVREPEETPEDLAEEEALPPVDTEAEVNA